MTIDNYTNKRERLVSAGKKLGFTLAEVLITLGIIGIVAQMTIPTLINSVNDQVYKTSYKKAFSELSQALMQATSDGALESATGLYDAAHMNNYKTIMSYFKTIKTCYNLTDNSACWVQNAEEWNSSALGSGYPADYDSVTIDAAGMSWATIAQGYAEFYFVDTNGFKKPNQIGKDRFMFIMQDSAGNAATGTPVKVITGNDNDYYMCYCNKCGTPTSKDFNTYLPTTWLSK